MRVHRTSVDTCGNPRYVIHWLDVPNADTYEQALALCRAFGGKQYRAKWFGGGIVFQSYNVAASLTKIGIDKGDIEIV